MGVGLARRCVVSNLGNMEIEQGKDASNFNCLAVCVEGGPVTRVENIMMHEIVANVRPDTRAVACAARTVSSAVGEARSTLSPR